jgi:iron(III) transport system substrate-binding protein
MAFARTVILLAFALVVLTPLAARRMVETSRPATPESAERLIVWTPHVEQIRQEFGAAFDRWHRRVHGKPVHIDWRTPGGTTEIRRMLESQYQAAALRLINEELARDPRALLRESLDPAALFTPGTVPVDLVFGGGSFDHGRLRDPRSVTLALPVLRAGGAGVGGAGGAGGGGSETTVVARVKLPPGTIDPKDPESFREAVVDATIDGQTLNLRLRPGTVVGGAAALAEVARQAAPGATAEGEVRLDLTQAERVFMIAMSVPAGYTQQELDVYFGKNEVGAERLYDPEQHWIGTALSGFGIVYNRDTINALGLQPPVSFADLTDYRYAGGLALADPRQSGSVATLYDSILNKAGWDEGWRILREMSANARYFSASSTQPPMDVSQGEAAAGVAIDFYGRGQAQAVLQPGETAETGRVGYIDPPGAVYIDADPISIMRGGPNFALARRFLDFVLSDEGQALWQFPPRRDPLAAEAPIILGTNPVERLGPVEHRLRRMPVRRAMYKPEYLRFFADRTDPFQIASDTRPRGWRDGMITMLGCMAIDAGEELRAAWHALNQARGNTVFPPERLAKMEELFARMPEHEVVDRSGNVVQRLTFSDANYRAISEDTRRWRDPVKGVRARIAYTEFFRRNFLEVVELGRWSPE